MGVKGSKQVAITREVNGNTNPTPATSHEDFLSLNNKWKKNIDEYGKMGLTRLHLACEVGDVARVVTLLLLGADPNLTTTSSHGYTPPLIFAASNGHTLCVMALLQRGACPNGTDAWGNTAIFKAATYNHVECVKILLKYGANPDVPNNWGAIPLQYSALQGHGEIVHVLLDAGCDPNSRGEKNSPPPLSAAALRGRPAVLKKLLEAGADVNIDNTDLHHTSNMKTPLYYALSRTYYYDSPYVLAVHGLTESTRETARKECCYADCIRSLLEAGAIVNPKCLSIIGSEMLGGRGNVILQNVRLAILLLRSTVYDGTMSSEMKSIMKEVCAMDATRSAKYEKIREKMIELIYRTGYTPSKKDRQVVIDSFAEDTTQDFICAFSSPRKLSNLAALKVRESLPGNPLSSSANGLKLPPVLLSEVTMDFDMN